MNLSLRTILSLSWQSVAYGVGVVGSQVVVYLMLPVLTHNMSKEEYGAIPVILALFGFLNMLTNAGLPSATFQFYNNTEDEKERQLTLGGSQFLFFIFATIPAILMVLYARQISTLLLGSEEYALALKLVACYLVTDTMNTFGEIILRIQVRPLISSIHSIFMMGCQMGLSILFVVRYKMGVTGYWLGYLIGSVIALAVMIWLVRKAIVFNLSWKKMMDMTKFGFPLIPAALSMVVLRLSDRYIISALVDLDQVAIYDIGYKAGSLILLFIAPFRLAWTPFAFSISQKPEAPKIYRDVLAYLLAACSFLILGAVAFQTEIVSILAPDSYASAVSVVSWVAASHLFIAIYMVFSARLVTTKKGYHLAWISVLASILNILLDFILIPSMGIVGAAIATFAGYGTQGILTYFISKRSFDIKVDWLRMGKLALAAGLVALFIPAVEYWTATVWLETSLKFAGLLAFPILLLLFRFVNPAQTTELLNLGRSLMSKKLAAIGQGTDDKS